MAKKFSLRAKIDTENGIGLKSDPPRKLLAAAPQEQPKSGGALETIKTVLGMGGSTVQEKKSSAKPIDEEREKQDDIETEEDEREPVAAAAMDTKSDVPTPAAEDKTKGDIDDDNDSSSSSSMDTAPEAAAPVPEKKKKAASVKVKSKSKPKPKGGKGLGKSLPKPKRHGKNGEKKPNIDAAVPKSSMKRLHYRGHITDPKTGKIIVMKRNKHIYGEMRTKLRAFLEPIIRDIAIFTEHARRKTVLEQDAHLALKRHGCPLWGSMEGGDGPSKRKSASGGEKKKAVKIASAEETVKALTAPATPAAASATE
jgi:histone H3/H4